MAASEESLTNLRGKARAGSMRVLLCSSLIHAWLGQGLLCAMPRWDFQFAEGMRPPYYNEKNRAGILPDAPADCLRLAIDVPEGNYRISATIPSRAEAAGTTIYAESRRLMLHHASAGQYEFTVNVRQPAIAGGGVTELKDREKGPPASPSWDSRLSLEIWGPVDQIQVEPATDVTTVYLVGDSTVTDQHQGPYFGWGQMLPRYFQKNVAIANHAESGLALFSFKGSQRLKKVESQLQPGDYLFIQFGHNDQKDKKPTAGPFTSYKSDLKDFIRAAREKAAFPVLITPMERRRWKGQEIQFTLTDYAEAVRQAGAEEKVPVIDLHRLSIQLYAALGPENSKKAFVHYPPNSFPEQEKPLADDTHHNAYGGYELARAVVEGIRQNVPDLAKKLAADAGSFAPSKPDLPENVKIPWDPQAGKTRKPDGN